MDRSDTDFVPLKVACTVVVVGICALASGKSDGALIVYADSDFAEENWRTQTALRAASSATIRNYQSSGGIGDDSYRTNYLYLRFALYRNTDQRVAVAHIHNYSRYDPQKSGAIESVEFTMDIAGYRADSNQWYDTPPWLTFNFMAFQDGEVYNHRKKFAFGNRQELRWLTYTDGPLNLVNPTHVGLTASDFSSFSNSGKNLDFSRNAKPIEFGYFVNFFDSRIVAPNGFGGSTGYIHVDNWRVTLDVVPETSSISLSLVGLLIVGLVHRRPVR